jgi:preprotein translocase subunit SecY
MASAAEQLAANINWSAFAKADELKKRIWFTLGALVIYRLGTYIPLPGIDPAAFEASFLGQKQGVLDMFNMFSGGAVQRMAVFALNIMPYISASIIIQLLSSVVPSLEAIKKEGEQGRKVLNQYTRYLTVVLAIFQAYGISIGLEGRAGIVSDPGLLFRISTIVTLTGGTMFLVWLGEQITSRGVGNGSSLIIFAGIVARLPQAVVQLFELGRQGSISTGLVLAVIIMVFVVVAIFVIRLLLRLEKTADEITQSARAFRDSLSEATLAVREIRQTVASFGEAAAPIRRAAERFGRLGDRAAGITSALLDEVEEPLTNVLSLLRGLRGVARYFLTRFTGGSRGKTHEEDSPQ